MDIAIRLIMLSLGYIFRMLKFLLLLLLLFGCSQIAQTTSRTTCQNDGTIDFMYINIPCKECIELIKDTLDANQEIFSYDITENNIYEDVFILINYCYNYNTMSSPIIEESITDKGFIISGVTSEEQKIILKNTCCN